MIRKGYSKNFTVAVTAISSTIGIIIPPSIPMVVIAGICGISTGKLFLGGIIPGILCGLAQMIVSYFLAKKEGVPKEPGHFTIGPVLHGLWESWPALLMPIIIVGTITIGIVSPTEAGVIAVVYGLFAGGTRTWRDRCCLPRTHRVQVCLCRDRPHQRPYLHRHRRSKAVHRHADYRRL